LICTRYVALLVRTFVDPADADDLAAVHALQDAIKIWQPTIGTFEVPAWDEASLRSAREATDRLPGFDPRRAFGALDQIDPIHHLIGTARGWGGNPVRDAIYVSGEVEQNDSTTVYRLSVRDVPVDRFWRLRTHNGRCARRRLKSADRACAVISPARGDNS